MQATYSKNGKAKAGEVVFEQRPETPPIKKGPGGTGFLTENEPMSTTEQVAELIALNTVTWVLVKYNSLTMNIQWEPFFSDPGNIMVFMAGGTTTVYTCLRIFGWVYRFITTRKTQDGD
jgi:hypothetical protein